MRFPKLKLSCSVDYSPEVKLLGETYRHDGTCLSFSLFAVRLSKGISLGKGNTQFATSLLPIHPFRIL